MTKKMVLRTGSKRGWARPVLRIANLAALGLGMKDTFVLARFEWTVIAEDLAISEDAIEICSYREDKEAADVLDYEASDVKKCIDNWAERCFS